MRYTQYTHKVSIPMRKELYDFLSSLPRGSRTDMGREFFLYVQAMLAGSSSEYYFPNSPGWNKDLRKLCKGNYVVYFPEEAEDET